MGLAGDATSGEVQLEQAQTDVDDNCDSRALLASQASLYSYYDARQATEIISARSLHLQERYNRQNCKW